MKLSFVIPARNEEGCVEETLRSLARELRAASIPFEVVAVDDGSTDGTADRVRALAAVYPEIRLVANTGRNGFGMAVRAGLAQITGDAVAVMMADGSDSPADVVAYYRKLQEGYDCVFGSRFIRGSRLIDYPVHKLVLNRMANWFIRVLFQFRFNDTTNAFKCYRRDVIDGIQPLISPHFNLTVEMPLKAIVRGYSYAVVPIRWANRKSGISKLKLREMGSRYLFIILYLWLEKMLARGDYHRRNAAESRHV
ncbi:MAG TPA: glycosyltransferase family 2 protein [Bryobacteraceae bacterium]|nr:glycosyltransferase family 2 protein [Bryobacteraceae bacterium]